MKHVLGLFVLLCLVLQSTAQQTINASVMVDGSPRTYILYIPANYSSTTPAPLVFNFHGYTSSAGTVKNRAAFESIADTAGFIVAHPQGSDLNGAAHWNVGGWTGASTANDIGFVSAMIDSISANYNVSAKRIYSTGFSNGGFFSYELACRLSDKIAAIASVSGSMTDKITNNCNAKHPTPLLQIHGTSDAVIAYGGSILAGSKPIDDVINYWVAHNNCNTTPTTSAIPNTNTVDGSTVELIAYAGGDKGAAVELLKVTGGAHEWPGNAGNMDINASLEIWNFFSRYTLDGAVVSVADIQDMAVGIGISPNPTTNLVKLSFYSSNSGQAELVITDLQGRIVSQKELSYKVGNNVFQLDVSSLVGGMYILSMQSQQIKLVIE